MKTESLSISRGPISRRTITRDVALSATSRTDEFDSLLERSGFESGSDDHLPEALRSFNLIGVER